MQGRWLIAVFTVVLGLLCVRQLSYTYYVNNVESKAEKIAAQTGKDETQLIKDSLGLDTVNLFVAEYNYFDAKKKQMNLGLDLKGGINTILQVSVKDLLNNFSDESENPLFQQAIAAADEAQKNSDKAYLEIFFEQFDRLKAEQNSSVLLAATDIFGNLNNSEILTANIPDAEAKPIIRQQISSQVSTAYQVIRSRIDQFGVAQPNVQRLGSEADGRILVELPGVKDTERVRKILQSTAKLEFWEATRGNQELNNFISGINAVFPGDTIARPINSVLLPSGGNSIAQVELQNKDIVDQALKNKPLTGALRGYKFAWGNKPVIDPATKAETNIVELYALVGDKDGKARLDGDVIQTAEGERDANSLSNEPIVTMTMNTEGAKKWAEITGELKGRPVAIVLDDLVYSAPNVNDQIIGGRSQISGSFTLEEAQDLASVLEAGSLPASADIIQEAVVGPSLGKESIQKGLISFLVALLLVLGWMIFYYSGSGIFSNVALIVNMLLLFGILAAFHAVLTLPGIAGIILTIGMAVDANVIIYERVKEELAKGVNVKQAVKVAYSWKGAISAIIDANVTTLLTALVLFFFGEGPVKGFATTLMIGIFTSVFCAIFLTRYFIEGRFEKGKSVNFFTKVTKNWFQDVSIDFLSKRKIAFIVSGVALLISLVSLSTRGLNFGIDFVGGRTYTVRFDQPVKANEIANALAVKFVDADGTQIKPEVKTFGDANQVKITTKYKYNDDNIEVDDEIRDILFAGLKDKLPADLSVAKFASPDEGQTVGIMSSNKVGPTIADDITKGSLIAISIALTIVFLYILGRFRKWQFSAGAVAAVFHDVIIVLGFFSLLHGFLPFSLEIDQAFIAAILTVIGYSLNDTVIVFDRIREFLEEFGKMPFGKLINKAINTTLSRTINTSLTTIFVVLIILLFGGETIRGFMFALMLGIIVGTYSSIFIATPLMYQFTKKELRNRAE